MVKQILFLFFLILLFFGQFITNVKGDCVTNGLVLWLKFDEGQGNIAYDWSYHNNNGILYNNPTWVKGIYGYAVQLNGINQYVSVPLSSSLSFPADSAFSITLWVYTNIINNSAIISSGGTWFIGQYGNSAIQWGGNLGHGGQTLILDTNTTAYLNKWAFVAFVTDGKTLYAYRNGLLIGTSFGNFTSWFENIAIGQNVGFNYFNGIVDDVRIYNRALSQAEIQQIYYNTQPYVCVFTTSTTVYQNQIVQTNTAQGYSYFAIDPYNIGVLVLILVIGFLFFVFERRLILIGIGIGFLIAYFFLGINIGFVLLGFIFIILNIILLRRYET